MAKFNLEKEKQRVSFTLQKRNLPTMRASVGLTLDVSGSIEPLFKQGVIQRLVEQIVPIGLRFDDNGNLDVYTFSSSDMIAQVDGATEKNYDGFVRREIINNSAVPKWGGTDYSPVLNKMLEDYGFYGGGSDYNRKLSGNATPSSAPEKKGFFSKLFGGSKEPAKPTPRGHVLQESSASGEAVINYFITDGENSDQSRTYELLRKVRDAKANIYIMFIGVGRANFQFIERCGNDFSNVGFLNVADLQAFTDSDDIYEKLLPDELVNWLKQKATV